MARMTLCTNCEQHPIDLDSTDGLCWRCTTRKRVSERSAALANSRELEACLIFRPFWTDPERCVCGWPKSTCNSTPRTAARAR